MVGLRKNYHKPMVSVSTYVIMLKNMLDIYVKLKKYYPHILLIALVFFAFFLRFYRLSDFPPALYQDETAIGYNAYLIIQKGVDEYGKSFPLYFQSFGDYKLPVYIYLSALSIKIFGYSAFSIRFPSAFFGSLSVVVLFFLTYSLTKKKSLSFVAAFLLAINPWHLQFSRSGFEVNIALFFSLLGTIFFLATCKNRRSYLLIPSVLSFALSLYSYNVTRLLVPFFIGALLYSNWSSLKKMNLYYILFVTAFLMVLLLPFLITLFNPSGIYSAQSNLVTGADIRANNIELRSYLGTLPAWYTKIMFNNYVYLIYAYMENLARTISGSFFFVQGPSELTQGIGTTGPFYLFQLPFFIYGIVLYFKKTKKDLLVFFWWFILSLLVLSLSKQVPHATRGYFLVIPISVFCALGIIAFFNRVVRKSTSPIWKYAFTTLFVCIACYSIQRYFVSYYYRAPRVGADAWRVAEKDLALYLKDHHQKYDRIIIENGDGLGFMYTSLLFYAKADPNLFLTTARRKNYGLLTLVNAFDNYEIRAIDWKKDILRRNTLLITNDPTKVSPNAIVKTFYNPVKYIVIAQNEKIIQAPVRDVKFAIVATDKIDAATKEKYENTP